MKLPFLIASRYLFSKKKHNAINIISAISVCGIALATLALVCTLSVFNGFQDSVANIFTAFDPELKITSTQSKVFNFKQPQLTTVYQLAEVDEYTCTLEENAMVKYKDQQSMVVVKGVDNSFHHVTKINTLLYGKGDYQLKDEVVNYGIVGGELASFLGTGVHFVQPLQLYAPKKGGRISVANPMSSFNTIYLYSPGALFTVGQQKYDANYILCALEAAQELFGAYDEISAIELKLHKEADIDAVKTKIEKLLGQDYKVSTRHEQQTDVFNIMEIEKFISYFFLVFILLIACFNIVSSLSMLILEKRYDMQILKNMGADNRLIANIFLYEGRLITLIGTSIGLLLGIGLTLAQHYFQLITLGGGHQFITQAYPVSLRMGDLLLILATVLVVGFASAWYPTHYLSRKILTN